MTDQFDRTRQLIGEEALEKLSRSRVAVFGIGGVGGYVCEALVRSGVGAFDLVDSDTVSLSNLNRQIIATMQTIGRYKAEVMKERMLLINPKTDIRVHNCLFLPENAQAFPFEEYDYVVDAVDTVTAKIELILRAKASDVPVISSMGAGNKLDPGQFRIADIYETSVCPLAKVMRRELKRRGVTSLKVVYSRELPLRPDASATADQETPDEEQHKRRSTPGSIAFVPSVAGLMIAGEVVKDLAGYGSR